MKIEIKKITLTNFKGIRHLVILFEHITNIFGDNATGKTTVFDAFLWLLFGKDSTDRKDFEIKTLDEHNQPYHRLDHEVSAVMLLDGDEINIKRSLREKWVKKRGSSTEEFAGHETAYFWNDVPMKQEEFQAKISVIASESLFKLLTNTTYFNSLKWQDRRNALLKISGGISDSEILDQIANAGCVDVAALIKALNSKKTIDEFKRELAAKKKKIKDELLTIPSRIEELNRGLSLMQDVNAISVQNLINGAKEGIVNIDSQLMDKSNAEKQRQSTLTEHVKTIGRHNQRIAEIETEINNSVITKREDRLRVIGDEKRMLRQKQDELSRNTADINYNTSQKNNLIQRQTDVRNNWHKINAETLPAFDDSSCKCPACNRVFENVNIEDKKKEFTQNFNTNKSKRLKEQTDLGVSLGNEIAAIDTTISSLQDKSKDLNSEITVLNSRINNLEVEHQRMTADEKNQVAKDTLSNAEIKKLHADITSLEALVHAPNTLEDNSALITRKRELSQEVDQLQEQLGSAKNRQATIDRIKELSDSESQMNQELTDLESSEYAIEVFTKAKMDELEKKINGKFKYVTFKMFEQQINGGEVECCETLINGVPYSDANTASKINAGLDIINTLSEHFGVSAPVFIDNRESITKVIDSDSQLINLIVSPGHKKLTVQPQEMAMAG
ncbi:MAG: AAA family ATPase [Agriterribacter sp.]